jgi:hypothetical protein
VIAAASQIENEVENLWKRGPANRLRDFPDFGRYIYENQFKAFKVSAHFLWCSKEHLYKDKIDLTWDILLPVLTKFNDRHQKLLKVILLMLEESMIGWMPKLVDTFSLSKFTNEP